MKSAQRSVKRGALADFAALIATGTLVMGGGWCFLMLFATAIGSKAPTMMEMLAIFWPALVSATLAIAAFVLLNRGMRLLPFFLALAGPVTLFGGIKYIVP